MREAREGGDAGRDRGLDVSGVSLAIRRLRLAGFSALEARRVEDGFRAELARLAAAGAPAGAGFAAGRVVARDAAGTSPERVGADAARALYESLVR